jgi:hypothetical protein
MNDYYVYAYLREDGTPYYIGKGKNNRAYVNTGRPASTPKDKNRIIKLFENLTEEESFLKEIEKIKEYGRKDNGTGILLNKTNGGEGMSGHIPSEETRQKRSKKLKGRLISVKQRLQISKTLKEKNLTGEKSPNWGKKASEETRKKLSDSHKGYVPSEEARRKNGLAHKGKFVSEETRKKQSLSLKGLKRSEEVKQRLRQLAKRGEENPNYGKKRPDSISKKAWETRTENIRNNPENIKAKGYTWVKRKNKWKATIRFKGKDYFLGYHITQEDARKAYLEGVNKLYNGENDISSGTSLEKNLGIANT